MAKAKRAIPEGYHTVTPVLVQDDTVKAIDWYKTALGAEEIARAVGGDGKVMHAEIRVGDSRVMMNDAMMGAKGPREMGGSPASLWLFVDDCDAYFKRAIAGGATQVAAPADMFWGDRFGAIADPFGYRWSFATRKEDLTPDEMQKRQKEWEKQMLAQMGEKK